MFFGRSTTPRFPEPKSQSTAGTKEKSHTNRAAAAAAARGLAITQPVTPVREVTGRNTATANTATPGTGAAPGTPAEAAAHRVVRFDGPPRQHESFPLDRNRIPSAAPLMVRTERAEDDLDMVIERAAAQGVTEELRAISQAAQGVTEDLRAIAHGAHAAHAAQGVTEDQDQMMEWECLSPVYERNDDSVLTTIGDHVDDHMNNNNNTTTGVHDHQTAHFGKTLTAAGAEPRLSSATVGGSDAHAFVIPQQQQQQRNDDGDDDEGQQPRAPRNTPAGSAGRTMKSVPRIALRNGSTKLVDATVLGRRGPPTPRFQRKVMGTTAPASSSNKEEEDGGIPQAGLRSFAAARRRRTHSPFLYGPHGTPREVGGRSTVDLGQYNGNRMTQRTTSMAAYQAPAVTLGATPRPLARHSRPPGGHSSFCFQDAAPQAPTPTGFKSLTSISNKVGVHDRKIPPRRQDPITCSPVVEKQGPGKAATGKGSLSTPRFEANYEAAMQRGARGRQAAGGASTFSFGWTA